MEWDGPGPKHPSPMATAEHPDTGAFKPGGAVMPWVKVWGCSTLHMLVHLHPLVLPLPLLLFFTPSLASAPAWLDFLCFPFLAWEYPIPGAWSGSPDWSSTLPRKLCLFLSLGGTICSNHPNSSWALAPKTSYSMALLEEGSKRMRVGHSFKFWCYHFLAWVGDY